MKKVLFASSAIVIASAGIAAADVSLSGSAEIGIFGGTGLETQFHNDVDVTFTMAGETDNGLSFGGSVDLDEGGVGAAAHADDGDDGGIAFFVSGAFGTLTLGDTDGGFDWALTEAIIGGALQDDHEHGGYSGNGGLDGSYDGQIARYEYVFGDFSAAVSAEIDDTGVGDAVFGIGAKYNADLGGISLGVGVGFQTGETEDIYGISLDASFDNGFRAILNYSDLDTAGDHFGIAVGYSLDALTVSVNYGQFDTAGADTDGFGLIVNYDLGGGAELQAGYGQTSTTGAPDVDSYSFGLAMSF